MAELKVKKTSNPEIETNTQDTKNGDFLDLLKREFFYAPFLKLLSLYLSKSNGKSKTIENCISEFRQNHKIIYSIIAGLDFLLVAIFLIIVLTVVSRGLGLLDFGIEVTRKLHQIYLEIN